METKAFYQRIGGDYADVLSRLGKDERSQKYLGKFAESTEYQQLCQAIEIEDWELGFRMAHTLKGVAANLGFNNLFLSSSALCETLRAGDKPGDGELEAVTTAINQIFEALHEYEK